VNTSSREFKVLTLNLHKGFAAGNRRFVLPELREAVRTLHADVVFLQEVLGDHATHALKVPGWPAGSQYEFLADTIWKDFAYGQNAVYPHGHHGNALLSKFPIVEHRNHDISVSTSEKRGLLHCRIAVPPLHSEIHAICVHLSLFEKDRQRQLGMLCRLLTEKIPPRAPVLIAGDFNDWRQRAGTLLERCGLREAFIEARGRAARSFPARWPLLPLDRIYFRNASVMRPAIHAARPWSHLSDHLPLSAEVVL
jgi:endonuclease/exonuclease/phosphatase family metal-dependent hydrolase